jgi:hypothetical protein
MPRSGTFDPAGSNVVLTLAQWPWWSGTAPRRMLIARQGLRGPPGSQRPRPVPQAPTAADLVDRDFHRNAPSKLWVTDIT